MRRGLLLSFALLIACHSGGKKSPGTTEVRGKAEGAVIEAPRFEAADFCPTKKSFSLANARWLSRLALTEYKHYSEAGPAFEKMGFGSIGDGDRYKKKWYIHRIKLIEEKEKSEDDSWFGEAARLDRLELVKEALKKDFGVDYVADGQKAVDFETSFIEYMDNSKIQMISAKTKSKLIAGSTTQFAYLENISENYSVIAFRGTEPDRFVDILTDINYASKPLEGMGRVHAGFLNALEDVEPELMAFLKKRTDQGPLNLWLTGHSLGGALATLLSAKIILLKEKGEFPNLNLLGVYSFGSPRLGDPEFARTFDKLTQQRGITAVRFRNSTDPVTEIPGGELKLGNYIHIGSLAYFAENGFLFQRGGWAEIESKSDFLIARKSKGMDHKMLGYEGLVQKAYDANLGTELVSCDLIYDNVPPLPFYEDKTLRN